MKGKIVGFFRKHVIISMVISGLIGAIIGWGLSWILPSKPVVADNMPKKELTCILDYTQKLVSKNSKDDMLKLIYNDVEVTEPHLVSITITNTGNYAIDNEDFKKDFSIDFGGCNRIVTAKVVKSSNKAVWDEILSKSRFEGTELIITDFFLNLNETFTLNIITDKKPNAITYSPRISGVGNLTLVNTTAERIKSITAKRDIFVTIMIIIASVTVIGGTAYLIAERIRFKGLIKKLQNIENCINNLEEKE